LYKEKHKKSFVKLYYGIEVGSRFLANKLKGLNESHWK